RFTPCSQNLQPAEQAATYWIARQSTHPHALQVANALKVSSAPKTVTSFSEVPGYGIEGKVEGHWLRLGSRAWFERSGIAVPELNLPFGGVSYLSIDGNCRGVFVVSPEFRPQVQGLLCQLRGGPQLALLSGDNDQTREMYQQLFGE